MNNYPRFDLVRVTEHYGYTYELYNGKWQHIIWHLKDGKKSYAVTGRFTRTDTIKECKYLEKLNFNKENNK